MPNQKTHGAPALAALKQSGRLWLAVHRSTGRVDDTGPSWRALRWRWSLHSHRIEHIDHAGAAK